MERRGDAKNGHDDGLVLFVNVDLHFPDFFFSGHLRHVFVGHIGLFGPEEGEKWTKSINV